MIGWLRITAALVGVAVATSVLVPLQLLAVKTHWFGENRFRGLWHRINVKAMGFRVHVSGELTTRRPLLVASNHISWTDIEILASLFDITFIAKSELAGWPVIGRLSKLQRPVYVERENRRKSGAQASEIALRLSEPRPMVLFPEGSTGDGNRLLPFKSTLFGAAAKAVAQGAGTVYIQPLAIAYTRIHGVPMGRRHRVLAAWIGEQELVPHLAGLLREGAIDVELHFGEPLEFSVGTDRKEMARQVERLVRGMMREALADPRPSAVQESPVFCR
jgi:1-acyl-sn-glycerol-3-phosphate acyltransferase